MKLADKKWAHEAIQQEHNLDCRSPLNAGLFATGMA